MAPTTGMVVTFRNHVIPDEVASKAQGRPIFKDMEVCDIRLAGQRATYTFPATETEPNATRAAGTEISYAEVYSEQYRAFKSGADQPAGGTPLSEATFLTEGKRRELKALGVHTVETLAAIDGTPLKQLGMGGREMKTQAQAYLDKAAGSADVTGMAATIASLQQQLEDQRELMGSYLKKGAKTKYQRSVEKSVAEAEAEQAEADEPEADDEPVTDSQYVPEAGPVAEARALDDLTDAEIKDFIKEETGEPVRGNPSRETLIARATVLLKEEGDK